MNNLEIFPIGSKVKHGESEGYVTQISLRGDKYVVAYLISVLNDNQYQERWVYDFEFTCKAPKIKLKFTIG